MNANRTIVIGTDMSQASEEALAWTLASAGPGDRIRLLHAWEIPVVTGYDVVVAVDVDEAERLTQEQLESRVRELDDDRVVPVLRRGHAGRTLVEEAGDADLLVVSHRGHSRLSLMLGSTANYVVHHATTPVVVVRGDEPVSPPRRVVVGVDDVVGMDDTDDGAAGEVDSPSLRALRWAVDLPGVEHVTALHAWFLPPIAVGMFTPNVELAAMDQAAKRVAQRAAAAIGPVRDGVTLEAVSGRGSADFAMREASRDADLVVVGSRGRGGFSELLLGSTIAPLLAHSHAPVAVIR